MTPEELIKKQREQIAELERLLLERSGLSQDKEKINNFMKNMPDMSGMTKTAEGLQNAAKAFEKMTDALNYFAQTEEGKKYFEIQRQK